MKKRKELRNRRSRSVSSTVCSSSLENQDARGSPDGLRSLLSAKVGNLLTVRAPGGWRIHSGRDFWEHCLEGQPTGKHCRELLQPGWGGGAGHCSLTTQACQLRLPSVLAGAGSCRMNSWLSLSSLLALLWTEVPPCTDVCMHVITETPSPPVPTPASWSLPCYACPLYGKPCFLV